MSPSLSIFRNVFEGTQLHLFGTLERWLEKRERICGWSLATGNLGRKDTSIDRNIKRLQVPASCIEVTVDLRQEFVLVQGAIEIRFLVYAILVDVAQVKILKRLSRTILGVNDLAFFKEINIDFTKCGVKAFWNGALVSNGILVKPTVSLMFVFVYHVWQSISLTRLIFRIISTCRIPWTNLS